MRKLILGALGAALATTFLAPAPAQAVCLKALHEAVPFCSPCDPVNAVLIKYGTHLDCVQ